MPSPSPKNSLVAETRAKWRAWLRQNHQSAAEVWLIFFKKHTGRKGVAYDAAVEEALCFGWVDSIKKRVDEDRYAFRFTPRRSNSQWSAINKQRVEALIKSKKMTKAGLSLVEAAKQSGAWDRRSMAEMEYAIPEELEFALAQNNVAKQNFDALGASYRKQYIGWVASAKRTATRTRRAREAVRLLRENRKLGLK